MNKHEWLDARVHWFLSDLRNYAQYIVRPSMTKFDTGAKMCFKGISHAHGVERQIPQNLYKFDHAPSALEEIFCDTNADAQSVCGS